MMVNVLVASVTGIAAAAQLVAGGLAWSGKLPGNGVVGLNIPEVRTSRERWDAAHRIAGPLWTLSGVALVFATLIAVVASGWMWLAFAFALLCAVVAQGVAGYMAARSAAVWAMRDEIEASRNDAGCGDGGGCGCCGDGAAEASEEPYDPSKDCGVAGGCGSCALNGSCEQSAAAPLGGGADVNVDAVLRAASQSDDSQR
ncbi:SdpI family protein [Corynebacterium argentoratense]|jgi:tryptophan-specific permease, 5-methyltryptophan resistance|uniref:SdpI family protein n=1 Tax=Corynebacterium argentoratense TaxID=42817 RepID=UPI003C6F54D2